MYMMTDTKRIPDFKHFETLNFIMEMNACNYHYWKSIYLNFSYPKAES